jgi:outer membrane receptor protein involved in Fe transport
MQRFNAVVLDFRRRRRYVPALLAGIVLLLMLEALSQAALAAPPGVVEGVAKDALGHPLADAQVKLEAADGSVVAHTTTRADGSYEFTGVAAGVYSVVAEKPGFDTATAIASLDATSGATADLTLAARQALDLGAVAQRLEQARLSIEPQIGASTYTMTSQAIETIPGGDNNPLNQVLLQAPGVDQDNLANGAIHIRNEHLGVQYRIDGVVLPEGVTFFGQGLDPRFINSLQLITGALPAEYGLRTTGIVDIQTKSGFFEPGGSVSLYGGSFGTIQPSFSYGTSAGGYNLFVSSDYLQSERGIDAVTDKYNQIHDDTQQFHGFAYLDKIIDSTSKVSLIVGAFDGRFEIPNNPGQPSFFPSPQQTIQGIPTSAFNSADLDERQTEDSAFAVLSYLKAEQDLSYQLSLFSKYSSIHFFPSGLGDLDFNGISQNALRTSFANGVQIDSSYRLNTDHTLRGGVLVTGERVSADTTSQVLEELFSSPGVPETDAAGNTLFASTPTTIVDDLSKLGWTYSVYGQDEWRVTPTVTLNYGARFDEVNTFVVGNQVSPRVNAVWKATPATTVHAGYANYFTPPSFELVAANTVNLFANTSGAVPTPLDNPPARIERSHYFDVGVAQDVLPGLRAGVDLYYKYARNLVDEGQFGAPVLLTPFNYAVGYNRGVELTTAYDRGPFSYYGNLAIAEQKGEDFNSAQFNFTPAQLAFSQGNLINTDHSQRMTASAGVSYLWYGTKYAVDIVAGTGLRTTRSDGPINGGTVPSYEQVNLGISHRFADAPGGPVTVRLDVVNVLDEVYELRSQTGVGVFAPAFGPRRGVFAGVTKEF